MSILSPELAAALAGLAMAFSLHLTNHLDTRKRPWPRT